MLGQAVARLLQAQCHALGSQGTKLMDVRLDRGQISQRAMRPDYLDHDLGGGVSSGVPQVSSQRATSS